MPGPPAPRPPPVRPGGLPQGLDHLPLDQGEGRGGPSTGAVLPQVRGREEVEEGGVPAADGPGGGGGEGGVWGGASGGGGV